MSKDEERAELEDELRALYPFLDEQRWWDAFIRRKRAIRDYRQELLFRGEVLREYGDECFARGREAGLDTTILRCGCGQEWLIEGKAIGKRSA